MSRGSSAKVRDDTTSWWWRALAELPLLAGVVGALGLLWLRGALFVLDGRVAGYYWNAWMHNGWHVVHGQWEKLGGFRKPFHGLVAAGLGEWVGYADAAVLVGSASMVAVVLGSAVTVRVLGGPAMGGLAALLTGASTLACSACHWGTGYPLLAAGTSLALAAGVVFAARPAVWSWGMVVGATLLALVAEDRGVLVLPTVACLAVVGAVTASRSAGGRRFLGLGLGVLGVLVCVLGPPAVDYALGYRAPIKMSAAKKREAQKDVVHRWLQIEDDAELRQRCATTRRDDTLEPAFFTTDCARAVLKHNAAHKAPRSTPLPGWALALGLGAVLLGGGRRKRWATWGLVVPSVATIGAFSASTVMPPRYVLQFVGPLCLVLPLGLGRLLSWVPRRFAGLGQGAAVLLAVGVAVWAWTADVHGRDQGSVRRWGDWSEAQWALDAALVREHVPVAEAFLDCADHAVNTALLPDHVFSLSPFLAPDAGFCRQWVTEGTMFGPGRRWVSAEPRGKLFDQGRREEVRVDLLVRQTAGWRLVDRREGFELWAWER